MLQVLQAQLVVWRFSLGVNVSKVPHRQLCACLSLEYLCHVCVRNDGLAGVVIADSEYPSRVAFTLLEKVGLQFGLGQTGVDGA